MSKMKDKQIDFLARRGGFALQAVLWACCGWMLLGCDQKRAEPRVDPMVRIGEGTLDETGGDIAIGPYSFSAIPDSTFLGPVTIVLDEVNAPAPLPFGSMAAGKSVRVTITPEANLADHIILTLPQAVDAMETHVPRVLKWNSERQGYQSLMSGTVDGGGIAAAIDQGSAVYVAVHTFVDLPPERSVAMVGLQAPPFDPATHGFSVRNRGLPRITPHGMCLAMMGACLAYRHVVPDGSLYNDLDLWESYALALAAGPRANHIEAFWWKWEQFIRSNNSVPGIRVALREHGACVLVLARGLQGGGHACIVFGDDRANSRFLIYDPNHPGETRHVTYNEQTINPYGPYGLIFCIEKDPVDWAGEFGDLVRQVRGEEASQQLTVVDPASRLLSPVATVPLTLANAKMARDWIVVLRCCGLGKEGEVYPIASEAYDGTFSAELNFGALGHETDFLIVSARNIEGLHSFVGAVQSRRAGSTIAKWTGLRGAEAHLTLGVLPDSVTVQPSGWGMSGVIQSQVNYGVTFTCGGASACERSIRVKWFGWQSGLSNAECLVHPGTGVATVSGQVNITDSAAIAWLYQSPGNYIDLQMGALCYEDWPFFAPIVWSNVSPTLWTLRVYRDVR
jgi:hypothetical protein